MVDLAAPVVGKSWEAYAACFTTWRGSLCRGRPICWPRFLASGSQERSKNLRRYIPSRRNFNEIAIGDTLYTDDREVTLSDIESFAEFTGDRFYAHMDEDAARANPFFPGRVAHGYLLLSFAAGLFVASEPGPVLANTGLNSLSFKKPVSPGDRIRARLVAKRKTRRTDTYGEVAWAVTLNNQDSEPVAEYELLTMVAYEWPASA